MVQVSRDTTYDTTKRSIRFIGLIFVAVVVKVEVVCLGRPQLPVFVIAFACAATFAEPS